MGSPLAAQIVRSINEEPARWKEDICWFRRDDGVSLCVIKPYEGTRWRPRLQDPRAVGFGWLDGLRIKRAVHRWLHRELIAATSSGDE
jgi:hypothetical protein